MFNKRYGFVLVLLILAITAISAVSANDLNTTDEVIGDEIAVDNELKQTDEVTVDAAKPSPFKNLNQVVSDAPSGATITLFTDYSYVCPDDSDYQGGIEINKDLTIDGNDHTIYGNGARIFVIEENAQVIIQNLKFVNTKDYVYKYGGSIYNSGELILRNCEFTNSSAIFGGAICSRNSLTVQSSTFTKNSAQDTCDGNQSLGGAIFSSGYCFIWDSVFKSNDAQFGGAIDTLGTTGIFNSIFILNSADVTGGCIYNGDDGVCIVQDSQFLSNSAKYAGALFQCTANSTYFKENYALEGNNMILGIALDCSHLTSDNDYVDVDLGFNVKLTPLKQTVAYGDKLQVKVTDKVEGKPISGITVKVKVPAGSGYKTYSGKTNANGIASITITATPKTYSSVAITSDRDLTILAGSTTSKLVVKKGTAKIIASDKSYKLKATKKYTITLKNTNGAVVKNSQVKIKVNGVTYKATTNSKGKATFTLSKLNKKGSFTSTITFSNSNYNKVTKKVKITVKK